MLGVFRVNQTPRRELPKERELTVETRFWIFSRDESRFERWFCILNSFYVSIWARFAVVMEQSTMQLMTTPGLAFGALGPRAQGQRPNWPLGTQGAPLKNIRCPMEKP